MDFEQIDDYRARAKIHGGWLVETISSLDESNQSIAMCFVPDLYHVWKLDNEPDESDEFDEIDVNGEEEQE